MYVEADAATEEGDESTHTDDEGQTDTSSTGDQTNSEQHKQR